MQFALSPYVESHIILRVLNSSFQTIDSISNIVADFFCSKVDSHLLHNGEGGGMLYCFRDLCGLDGNHQKRDFSNGDKGDAVFNVLDTKLKESLDRLSFMKQSITTWENAGSQSYSSESEAEASSCRNAADLRFLCSKGELAEALSLWYRMVQKGIVPDVIQCNYLINGLCRIGDLQNAEWLLKQMRYRGPLPSCATYNTLISGFCHLNNVDRALDLLSIMEYDGVAPNRVTHNILIHALCKKRGLEEAKKFIDKLVADNQFENNSNLITSTILMDHSFKDGDTSQALSYWEEMFQMSIPVDVVAYNVIVHGFCLIGDVATANKVFAFMEM